MIKLKTIPLFNMEVVFLMTDNWWPLLPGKKKWLQTLTHNSEGSLVFRFRSSELLEYDERDVSLAQLSNLST